MTLPTDRNLSPRAALMVAAAALACSLEAAPAASPSAPTTTAAPPTATLSSTEAPLALGGVLVLSSDVVSETSAAPPYTLNATIPILEGSADPRVTHFNELTAAIVREKVDAFKQFTAELPDPPITAGSFLDVSYAVVSPPGELVSMRFDETGYSDGAAHPYHVSTTFNYHLGYGQVVTLAQLFLPAVDHLGVLAGYCQQELRRTLADFVFEAGAEPTAENYSNWNITAEGLFIIFNEYQVAPYAAGRQSVLIPFEKLRPMLDPQGPLAALLTE
jgi:hypothetical protein